MDSARSRDHGYRVPPDIIRDAVWASHRVCLSIRDVDDLLAERDLLKQGNSFRIKGGQHILFCLSGTFAQLGVRHPAPTKTVAPDPTR